MKLPSPLFWRTAHTVLVALASLVAVVISLEVPTSPPAPKAPVVPSVIHVDGADADVAHDDALHLSAPTRAAVAAVTRDPGRFDFGPGLRGQDPTRADVLTGPLAAQEWPGCRTAFVRSFSQRTDTVKAIALHYTVSPDAPGWGDLDALVAFANNLQNEASWHFLIDSEGHCYYDVPTRYKAWTIGNLNSQTVNIEFVQRGTESRYAVDGPGFTRLKKVVRRIARLYGIPLRLGAVDGACHVTRRGIITHWMGGVCAGGHIDIRPYSIQHVVKRIRAPWPKHKPAPRPAATPTPTPTSTPVTK